MSRLPPTPPRVEYLPWYAIRTQSNFEKMVVSALEAKGYQPFLPCYQVRRSWSDGSGETSLPLFPGYVFCRFDARLSLPIVTSPGVVSIVGFGDEPTSIPDSEIEAVRAILGSSLAAEPCPFLKEGQAIRMKYGSLERLEGILLKKRSEWRIVVSVQAVQRGVSVEIDRDWVIAL